MSKRLSYPPDEDFDELVNRYEKYLTNEATGYFDVEEVENIVDYYLRKGRTRDSAQVLELGLRLHPGSSSLMIKRAKIYLAMGDTPKAFKILENYSHTNDYELNLLRIEALCRLDRTREAHLVCDQVIQHETEEIDAVCMDISLIFLSVLDMESALKYLNIGDNYNPNNTELLFDLAFCHESMLNTAKALQVYKRIIDLNPYSQEGWFNLGQIYFNQQEYTSALNAYNYAHVINPNDSLTCLQKAHTQFHMQQYTDAIETYKEYEGMSDDLWQCHLYMAECYERMENFKRALHYYELSYKENEDNYDALTGISICMIELEKFQEGAEFARKAIDIQEDAADAWVYLAEAYTGMDDTDNAFLSYLKSIAIDPNQPDTLMAIANIAMEQGEFELALKYYEEALLKRDDDSELENIDLFMSVAYYKIGDIVSAKHALAIALMTNLDAEKLFYELCPEAKNDF